jgi:hypothetical protein
VVLFALFLSSYDVVLPKDYMFMFCNLQRQKQVYLISLINKGRVVAKGKLVTTDSQREILGAKLGPEYCGVRVEGLENIELGNIIYEEVPRPSNQIRTLIDAIGCWIFYGPGPFIE